MLLKTICLLFAIESVLCAATPINGLYSTGFGGYAFLPGNMNFNDVGFKISNSNYNSGFNAGGALGYKNSLWHYEGEVSYIKAPLSSLNIDGIKTNYLDGYSQGLLGLANLYFDFPTRMDSVFQAYIGGGIGGAWIQNSFMSANLLQNQINNSAFAYQGTVGISCHFSEAYTLAIYYRYIGSNQIAAIESSFQAHLINGGISYRFDIDEFK